MFRTKLLFMSFILALASSSLPAAAATYIVNTYNIDAPDANLGLAGCDYNPLFVGNQCTLRAAVMQANANPGPDFIVLALDSTTTLTIEGIGGAEIGDLNITGDTTITTPLGLIPNNVNQLPSITSTFNSPSHPIFRIQNVAATNVEFIGLHIKNIQYPGIFIPDPTSSVLVDHGRFSNINGSAAILSDAAELLVVDSDFYQTGHSAISGGGGKITIRNSSFRRTRTDAGSNIPPAAIYIDYALTELLVENSTIDGSDNGFGSSPNRGGIYIKDAGAVTLRNVTLVNFAGTGRALTVETYGFTPTKVRVANSIMANSQAGDCHIDSDPPGETPDIIGYYNLIESGCDGYLDEVGLITGVDPFLFAPQNDAGSLTWYKAPFILSPVVDGGIPPDLYPDDSVFECTPDDQRGTLRPQDGDGDGIARCDLGAVELE